MSDLLFCPRCGSCTKPSRIIPTDGWFDCPGCYRVLGEPDWKNPNDLGVILEPDIDFASGGSIPKGRPDRRGGTSKGRTRSKPLKRQPKLFPLPIPPPGSKIVINSKNGKA